MREARSTLPYFRGFLVYEKKVENNLLHHVTLPGRSGEVVPGICAGYDTRAHLHQNNVSTEGMIVATSNICFNIQSAMTITIQDLTTCFMIFNFYGHQAQASNGRLVTLS